MSVVAPTLESDIELAYHAGPHQWTACDREAVREPSRFQENTAAAAEFDGCDGSYPETCAYTLMEDGVLTSPLMGTSMQGAEAHTLLHRALRWRYVEYCILSQSLWTMTDVWCCCRSCGMCTGT